MKDPKFNANGMAFTPHGVLVKQDDLTMMEVTAQFITDAGRRIPGLERENQELRDKVRYATPSLFVPDMIRSLEARADECDKNKWIGQAMAYRDAAGMMRKALG